MDIFKLSVFVTSFFLSVTALATDLQLFKNHTYGSTYTNYLDQDTHYDCTEDVGMTALCADKIDFLSTEFTEVLIFNDSKLESVTLIAKYSEPLYQKTISTLIGKFQLSVLQSNSDLLDLVKLKRESINHSNFVSQLSEFESISLTQGYLLYAFLDISGKSSVQANNYTELLLTLPEGAREIDLEVAEDDYDAWIRMNFSLPVLQVKNFQKLLNESMEDF